ncbi:MAG: hypothetical protein QOJ19_778 [Acidimicrobiia bacterium]|nr:hypothetical protein [Acidimicrobiia bacterium]
MTRGTRTTSLLNRRGLRSKRASRDVAWRRASLVTVVVTGLLLAATATLLGRLGAERTVPARSDEATTLVSARVGESAAISAVRFGAGRLSPDAPLPGRHPRDAGALTWCAALLGLGVLVEVLRERAAAGGGSARPSLFCRRGPPTPVG